MKKSDSQAPREISFESLYPNLDPEEREAAQERFDRYLALVLRIYERISRDPEAAREFRALTGLDSVATMTTQAESSSANPNPPTP